MARGKGKNPQWVYKDGDTKHAHYWRDCDHCGEWYLARVDGKSRFCSLRCSGKATNPCKRFTDREGYLICAKCGEEKHEDEFDLWTGSVTGRKPRCKSCRAEDYQESLDDPAMVEKLYAQNRARIEAIKADPALREKEYARQRRYRRENHAKVLAKEAAYRKAHPDRIRLTQGKRRAQINGTQAGDISEELMAEKRVYWFDCCWMCGTPDPYTNGKPTHHLEHVKPLNKGGAHLLCNLRPACGDCNRFKLQKWPFPTAAWCDPVREARAPFL